MSWFTPAELPNNKYYLFGQGGGEKLVQFSESALLGQIPIVQGVREGGDTGTPIVLKEGHPVAKIFMEIARETMAAVEKRNATKGPTRPVSMN